MASYVRVLMVVIAVAVPGALLQACGGDDGDPIGSDPTRIQVTVRADGAAEPGVTVRLFNAGGSTPLTQGMTTSNGQVTFNELDAGTYDVEVELPSDMEMATGEARRPVPVAAGQTATVTFELESVLPAGTEQVGLTGSLTFSPSSLTIPVGTTVRWRNEQAIFHTITPDGHSEWTRATVSNVGDTFEHTFNTAGTFPYFCEPHLNQGMTGTITVQ